MQFEPPLFVETMSPDLHRNRDTTFKFFQGTVELKEVTWEYSCAEVVWGECR